jgi:hypothetical protein
MKGRPFLGAFSGLIFGIALAGFLLTMGVLATDSILHVVLPIVFLLVGIGMAAAAPFKRDRLQRPATEPPAGS